MLQCAGFATADSEIKFRFLGIAASMPMLRWAILCWAHGALATPSSSSSAAYAPVQHELSLELSGMAGADLISEGDLAIIPPDAFVAAEETMVVDSNGGISHIKLDNSGVPTIHMLYTEVADASGMFRGHYDLLLWPEGRTVQVPQDGRCFWACLAAFTGDDWHEWIRPRMLNGVAGRQGESAVSCDFDRAEFEIGAAKGAMLPMLDYLQERGRIEEADGFRSGARLVEDTMIPEIASVLRMNIIVHHEDDVQTEYYAEDDCPSIAI